MFRGIVGERAEVAKESVLTKEGGEEVSWLLEGSSRMFGGDSLRFLYGDVVKVSRLTSLRK